MEFVLEWILNIWIYFMIFKHIKRFQINYWVKFFQQNW